MILRQSKFKRTTGKSRQLTLPSLSVREEPFAPTGKASFTLKYRCHGGSRRLLLNFASDAHFVGRIFTTIIRHPRRVQALA